MKEFKRHFILFSTLSICAVLVSGYYLLTHKTSLLESKSDQFIQDKEALKRLLENSSEIHRIWNEGEDSREWSLYKDQCLKFYKIDVGFDESLMRCNPMLLECNARFNKKLNYHFKDRYRYLSKSNTSHINLKNSGYLFSLEDNLTHKHLDLFLEDQCQEVFLQNRTYAYGEEVISKESEDYRFDNFNQNIYIDRHLVTNAEINEWVDFGNIEFTKGLSKKVGNELFLPATSLTINQMENFCSFKGKQLLTAHLFDAATFLPMDLSELSPKKNNRSPYYWTKKKSEFKTDCSLIYAEECLSKKKYQLNVTNPTWSGVLDSMGGVLEVFRNPIDPESNLKASSYYFKFNSPWHRLGLRAEWDGEGFELRHFDFKGMNPESVTDKFQVGFRCMRESK